MKKDKDDIFAACANGDGTYNGAKLMQIMFTALTGKSITEAEVMDAFARAKEKRQAQKSNARPAGD